MDLKEKKKEFNDGEDETEIIQKVEITVDSKYQTSVTGPLDNPLIMMKILADALNVVFNYNIKADLEAKEKDKESNLIVLN